MKTIINRCFLLLVAFLISSQLSFGQKANSKNLTNTKTNTMKTYVIEREIPGAGKFTPEQLKGIAQKSCNVVKDMGPSIRWVHSYVTKNKLYCIYEAENEELVRKHAKLGEFPCNSVQEVASMFSPKTAE